MPIIPHNKPTPSKELRIYTSLRPRMNLSASQKLRYENINKGHLGELKFCNLLNSRPSANRLALYDFLLESNQTEFQIDRLIFHHNTIFPLEIKNFGGDFYFEKNNWYMVHSKKEIRNPLLQLQRAEFLFKQLLLKLHVKMEVKPYIVFVNGEFTLYQSPLGLPIIYPTQLNRFIKQLNSNTRELTAHHTNLANKLISMHIEESANRRLPKYDFHQLRKGITCTNCFSFLSPFARGRLKCERCGNEENIKCAVMRTVEEFALLFPERKITTSAIYEWCASMIPKRNVRYILLKNMILR